MKEGPDIALLGSLIGDPARANILTALISGKALTPSELAVEANVTVQTTSSHLKKLEMGGLIQQRRQGRHKYFTLADDEVGSVLEAMMGLAAKNGHTRVRTGPKDPALRKSRVCYNHLAGEMGVLMLDSLISQKFIVDDETVLDLTDTGTAFLKSIDIDPSQLSRTRRPVCKSCLDWSARRSHLAGTLGTELLNKFYEMGWAKREEGSRIVAFSKAGETQFKALFPN
ncbi:MAG: winged helix-turn-helix domain-containing protein [Sneathiella sp.]